MRPSSSYSAVNAPRNIKNVCKDEEARISYTEAGILKNKLATMTCIGNNKAQSESGSRMM